MLRLKRCFALKNICGLDNRSKLGGKNMDYIANAGQTYMPFKDNIHPNYFSKNCTIIAFNGIVTIEHNVVSITLIEPIFPCFS